ncbi:MAG TPA: hypothetical protein VGB99_13435 [Acidobacteriota bacterium]
MNRTLIASPAALQECIIVEQRCRQVLQQALEGVHSPVLRLRITALLDSFGHKVDRLRGELNRLGASIAVESETEDPVPESDLPQGVRRLLSLVADWQRELWALYGEWQHDSEGDADREAFAELRRHSDAIRRECLDLAMLI